MCYIVSFIDNECCGLRVASYCVGELFAQLCSSFSRICWSLCREMDIFLHSASTIHLLLLHPQKRLIYKSSSPVSGLCCDFIWAACLFAQVWGLGLLHEVWNVQVVHCHSLSPCLVWGLSWRDCWIWFYVSGVRHWRLTRRSIVLLSFLVPEKLSLVLIYFQRLY